MFDDLTWSKLSQEEKIHLLDKDYPSQIRILYDMDEIPEKLLKVVTSNTESDLLNPLDKDDAIRRQVHHIQVNYPLFVQQNNYFIFSY